MSTLSISRRFEVDATPERVWAYLTAPELVVTCLPGAALVSSSGDGLRHEGTVTVKLGAMSVSYRGTAEFEEVDATTRKLRVNAKGRDKTGAGSAEMTMASEVVAASGGRSEVALEASVKVSGKIVTLGRGMIEVVSEQVLSEFAACLSEKLASDDEDREAAAADGGGSERTPADMPAGGLRITSSAAAPADGFALLWRAFRSWLGRLLGRG